MTRLRNWITNWNLRHQHPASRWLHAIGIPLTPIALILGAWQLLEWRWDLWWRPAGLLFLSYLLQWIGHRIEGNDLGELIPIKKMLGLPCVPISPRYQQENQPSKQKQGETECQSPHT